MTEWEQVVDAWQLASWEAYRDVARLGRKKRLPETQRVKLWAIFASIRERLSEQGLLTEADLFGALAKHFEGSTRAPFEFVVVDEAQDIGVAQLKFLASIAGGKPNALFFAGDLGQRIFRAPFSWKGLGVDIRGRSKTLRINYRTSHHIRMKVDCLLADKITDVDGNTEDRSRTISVFNGPNPSIRGFESRAEEAAGDSAWLQERQAEDMLAHEMGVFVRSEAELPRAKAALDTADLPYKILDENVETTHGYVSISTMHSAKGLEFRAVAVMAYDDEVIPLQQRIETVADQSDLEEVYNTERHLLYVACTRARDRLLLTSVEPSSEFLDDLRLS
jgi:superfamily I DNA/RNA helicase